MAFTIYALCAVTSAACTVLLFRSWRRSRQPLVAWTAAGFAGLTVNNVLLLVDLTVIPAVDLRLLRDVSGLLAVSVLLVGLIWESR